MIGAYVAGKLVNSLGADVADPQVSLDLEDRVPRLDVDTAPLTRGRLGMVGAPAIEATRGKDREVENETARRVVLIPRRRRFGGVSGASEPDDRSELGPVGIMSPRRSWNSVG